MPHRHQEIVSLCAECRSPADDGCMRCGKPLCGKHAPSDEERCNSCEGRFLELAPVYLPSKMLSLVSNIGLIGGLVATVGIGALVISQSIVSWSLVAAVGGMVGLYGIREAVAKRHAGRLAEARTRFLQERPGDVAKQLPKEALGGGGDEPS